MSEGARRELGNVDVYESSNVYGMEQAEETCSGWNVSSKERATPESREHEHGGKRWDGLHAGHETCRSDRSIFLIDSPLAIRGVDAAGLGSPPPCLAL